ncbi:hypothetical protein ROHU_028704 [Labeo rohita]|uniref:Uncharacterized protein n=1 Tax=Labeo rohita TaxID=84645 RepID=A0A498MA74_LABRO|nr:hypothetical protein ROHU_028704 [Labeo rohita]
MRCQSQAGLMAFGLSDRWAAKGPDKRTLAGCTSCIAWDLHKVAYCPRFSSCFLHVCAEVLRLMAVWLNTQTTQFSSPCSQARTDELLNKCDASRRLALWLLDFLTGGQQRVWINGLWPDARRASLGISSSEYDDSHALREFSEWRDGAGLQGNISKTKEMANGRVVKHADDTVLLALLSSSEYDDSHALLEFSACRDGAGLQGNIAKTKEMAI